MFSLMREDLNIYNRNANLFFCRIIQMGSNQNLAINDIRKQCKNSFFTIYLHAKFRTILINEQNISFAHPPVMQQPADSIFRSACNRGESCLADNELRTGLAAKQK